MHPKTFLIVIKLEFFGQVELSSTDSRAATVKQVRITSVIKRTNFKNKQTIKTAKTSAIQLFTIKIYSFVLKNNCSLAIYKLLVGTYFYKRSRRCSIEWGGFAYQLVTQ
jgi:hypothetical protein